MAGNKPISKEEYEAHRLWVEQNVSSGDSTIVKKMKAYLPVGRDDIAREEEHF